MGGNKKLNEEFFRVRKKHKEGYSSNKRTPKNVFLNLLITIALIIIYSLLNRSCSARIENNKLEYEKNTKR